MNSTNETKLFKRKILKRLFRRMASKTARQEDARQTILIKNWREFWAWKGMTLFLGLLKMRVRTKIKSKCLKVSTSQFQLSFGTRPRWTIMRERNLCFYPLTEFFARSFYVHVILFQPVDRYFSTTSQIRSCKKSVCEKTEPLLNYFGNVW